MVALMLVSGLFALVALHTGRCVAFLVSPRPRCTQAAGDGGPASGAAGADVRGPGLEGRARAALHRGHRPRAACTGGYIRARHVCPARSQPHARTRRVAARKQAMKRIVHALCTPSIALLALWLLLNRSLECRAHPAWYAAGPGHSPPHGRFAPTASAHPQPLGSVQAGLHGGGAIPPSPTWPWCGCCCGPAPKAPGGFRTHSPADARPQRPGTLAMIVCITPGTVWAELALHRSALLLHVLEVDDPEAVIAHVKQRYERPPRWRFLNDPRAAMGPAAGPHRAGAGHGLRAAAHAQRPLGPRPRAGAGLHGAQRHVADAGAGPALQQQELL